jgi:glycosyltransferase involved in cell wall biosynthesis
MADALDRHYGPLRDLRVIANGIWLDDYLASDARGGDEATSEREPFVLAAGRLWDEAKNVRLLADVASRLPWPVRVAGETWDTTLPAGVEPLGRLDRAELARVMRRASIFVHAARYEPFGLAPVEAAASGAALVLSSIPSLRALWAGSVDLVAPDDAEGLVEAVSALIASPTRRAAMADRARARARTCSARAMTEGYLALYRELEGTSGARATRPAQGRHA